MDLGFGVFNGFPQWSTDTAMPDFDFDTLSEALGIGNTNIHVFYIDMRMIVHDLSEFLKKWRN